jgi:hypothetical protein
VDGESSLSLRKKMSSTNVWSKSGKVYNLTQEATPATGTGVPTNVPYIYRDAPLATFQAYGTTTAGTGSVTVLIQGSNYTDANSFITIGTITLTLGTTLTSDGFVSQAPWKYMRCNISAISGTGAAVTVLMGV